MKIRSNIPNLLSILRIIISFILLPFASNQTVFLLLFILCGITDFLDGYIARKFHLESKLGAYLDSIADFIFFWIMLVYLFIYRSSVINTYKEYLIFIIVVRLLALFICRIRNGKLYILHTIGNKLSGFLIILALGINIIWPINISISIILLIALLSAIEEMLIMILYKSPNENTRSIFLRS